MAPASSEREFLEITERQTQDGRLECLLCPHQCKLRPLQTGVCKARSSIDGHIGLRSYGQVTNMAVDPIEKKPLFHFCPGIKTLSLGSWGCNMDCSYCENCAISQADRSRDATVFSPPDIIQIALSKSCRAVCFTYNEPVIYFEYVLDVAKECKKVGLKVILKTNGYAQKAPWLALCKSIDAMNIDWKGTAERYRSVAKTDGDTTLQRLEDAINMGVHVEVSVPVYHDSDVEEYNRLSDTISRLDPEIPVHLLKIFPANRSGPCALTSDHLLRKVRTRLLKDFRYVYIGNVFGFESSKFRNTTCSYCQTLLVEREGLNAKIHKTESCCDKCPISF